MTAREAASHSGAMADRGGQGIAEFVLHEARLSAAAEITVVGRALEQAGAGEVPLLVSIEDLLDCAVLVPVRAGETYGGLHLSLRRHLRLRRPAQHYRARFVDRMSPRDAAYFRLAVTESGINEAGRSPGARGTRPGSDPKARGDRPSDELLWIGAPRDTHAGLLVLVGHTHKAAHDPGAGRWPLPLSADLGVRIYSGARP